MSVPYLDVLGLAATAGGAGRSRCTLAFDARTANRGGTLHGGVTASLVFVAAGLALDADAAPVDLALAYLAPGSAADVTADATVLRRGSELAHVEVAVAAGGRPVARALTVQRVGPAVHVPAATVPPAVVPPEPLAPGIGSPSPFSQRLGIVVVRRDVASGVALLPWSPDLADARGDVHAGALASLVDTAAGAAAWAVVGFDRRGRAATVNMHLTLHAPARDEDVVGEAHAVAAHDGLFTTAVRLFGRRTGRVVGSGSAIYRISLPA
ncbi:MAG: thioesterase family protein [bacterium]|nr:thioesterase family protein [bacterium]